jgi:hypothetical protein
MGSVAIECMFEPRFSLGEGSIDGSIHIMYNVSVLQDLRDKRGVPLLTVETEVNGDSY